MTDINNIMRIDFASCMHNSDGKPIKGTDVWHTVMYNKTVISEKEVRKLIKNDTYEYDSRVVVTTPDKADNLQDKIKKTGHADQVAESDGKEPVQKKG